ncbi:MAG: HAD-IIIA family hydrolase [Bacteroidales bacterium]|nr:HAD-IIIA family hydrolase [Bacteroidales bacterium]
MKITDQYHIDKNWTLFLDRDGVINRRLVDNYVKGTEEFEFLPGVLDAMKIIGRVFGHIIVVSNQQGVGKGMMSRADVELVHDFMLKHIEKYGGRIDGIYYSPHLEAENNPMRKPGTGMGLKARKDHPDIDFQRAVMAGDTITDMQFGRSLGMVNVLINTDNMQVDKTYVDLEFGSLKEFAEALI